MEIAADGFSMISSDSMYRSNEFHPGRRESRFHSLHNLADSVLERTLNPPCPGNREAIRRAVLWDDIAGSFRKAVAVIPSGSYVVVCSNSGPYNAEFEDRHPADFIPEASCGILFVSMFRGEETNISQGWIQVGVYCKPTDGRLFASLRLMVCVAGRPDLEFMITNLSHPDIPRKLINLPREHGLPYGSVTDIWRPTNLGTQYFSSGGFWETEYKTLRDSFAADGDLYGHVSTICFLSIIQICRLLECSRNSPLQAPYHVTNTKQDEAVLYTRSPIIIVIDSRPDARFMYFQPKTVFRDTTWLEIRDFVLQGSYIHEMRREDAVLFDKEGYPVELLHNRQPSNPGDIWSAPRPLQYHERPDAD